MKVIRIIIQQLIKLLIKFLGNKVLIILQALDWFNYLLGRNQAINNN